MKYILIGVFLVVIGIIGIVLTVYGSDSLDRIRGIESYQKGMFVYVYNDKTQLWDRAREETLKNAACDKLHTYVIGEGK